MPHDPAAPAGADGEHPQGFQPVQSAPIPPSCEAVRSVGADLVFLQEVLGSHSFRTPRACAIPGRRRRNTVSGRQHVAAVRPTGATRCIPKATMAMPCSPSIRSPPTATSTSRWRATRSAACCMR
ncbi:hypothetical protein ACPA9J_18470 [Pseudomonas aeruginosa]